MSCVEIVKRPYGFLYRMTDSYSDIDHISSSIIRVEPKQKTSKHKHTQEEIWYIISGSGVVSGETHEIGIISWRCYSDPIKRDSSIGKQKGGYSTILLCSNESPRYVNLSYLLFLKLQSVTYETVLPLFFPFS